ncbi:MAG: 50S ribosomal protein L37ae [Candidatus Methanomethylicia archaeon]
MVIDVKSFGPRYGAGVRKKYKKIIDKMKEPARCPYCDKVVILRRISVGIWQCKKCNTIFTGGAYTPRTTLGKTFMHGER